MGGRATTPETVLEGPVKRPQPFAECSTPCDIEPTFELLDLAASVFSRNLRLLECPPKVAIPTPEIVDYLFALLCTESVLNPLPFPLHLVRKIIRLYRVLLASFNTGKKSLVEERRHLPFG